LVALTDSNKDALGDTSAFYVNRFVVLKSFKDLSNHYYPAVQRFRSNRNPYWFVKVGATLANEIILKFVRLGYSKDFII